MFTFVLAVMMTLAVLSGCATVKQADVQSIDPRPQVSKVLESPQQRVLKRKVAIARFSNETKYGQSFLINTIDENKDRIGKQASDILSAKLAATDKFLLLERTDIDKINKELKIGNLGALNIAADYLILGSVSEFGRKETSEVGVFSRAKKQKAYAKVNIRLVEVRTGQIIYSAEGAGEADSEAGTVMGVGERAAYDSTLNDKAISAAIAKTVNNVVESLMERPWRSYILAVEGSKIIISGGKTQGLRPNDSFTVYKRGRTVINPQTNFPLELPGQQVARITVESLAGSNPNDEVAICRLAGGSIAEADLSNYYIQEAN